MLRMTSQLSALSVVAPRVRSVPAYSFSSGVEALELAESVGLVPDQWQRDAVMDILAEDDAGNWAAFESGLIVPRQNGKGAVLEIVDLADMFLFSGGQRDFLSIHTAHEFKTAQEAFRRVLFWVENNDWLRKKVSRVRTSHGEEGLELLSGARLRFLARSNGSGRGFSCDRLTYDEAYDLPDETVAASLPTLSARPNPHVIYTSSAPTGSVKSHVLRRVMARGRCEPVEKGGDPRPADLNLCYIEFSADPKADLDDERAWSSANPGTESGRITVDFIRKERAAMSEVEFARERMGILDEHAGATVIDLDVWDAQADEVSMVLDPVAFAVDVSPDSAWSSIAVCGRRADRKLHVEIVERRRGTGWVVDRVEELVSSWQPVSVTLDAIGPAGALLPAFKERGIGTEVVSMTQYGQACAMFKNAVDDGEMFHKGQTGLTAALESGRKRPLGDAGLWGWHRRDTTDITPLVAATLAVFGFSRGAVAPEPEDNRVFILR